MTHYDYLFRNAQLGPRGDLLERLSHYHSFKSTGLQERSNHDMD